MTKYWTESEVQFIRDNHMELSPERMSDFLNVNPVRLKAKMQKLNLKYKSVIEKEKEDQRILKLHLEDVCLKDICNIIGCSINRVYRIIRKPTVSQPAVTPQIKQIQFPELLELKRLGLSDYQANDGDELYRYDDLSPSEKLIYHKLGTEIKLTA